MWDMEVGGPGVDIWQQQRVSENPTLGPGSADELLAKLGRSALSLAPGQLPKAEHEHWKGILGLDDSKPTPALQATKVPANPALARTAPGQAARASAPASPRAVRDGQGLGGAVRPERAGKRRRYDESSYEGYDEDGGYSTGGVDDTGSRRGSASKRQKRKVGGRVASFYTDFVSGDVRGCVA